MFSARSVSLFAVLYGVWLLLSGHWEPFLLIAGAVSCVIVVIIAHRMDVIDGEGHPIHLTWRAMIYFPWLFNTWFAQLKIVAVYFVVILFLAMPLYGLARIIEGAPADPEPASQG